MKFLVELNAEIFEVSEGPVLFDAFGSLQNTLRVV
jgi:hypothetical protein